LLGAAFAALSLLPLSTSASAQSSNSNNTDISNSWDNSIDVELSTSINIEKSLDIFGRIHIDGNVRADALSMATLDDKQLIDSSSVQFEDYQNANANTDTTAEPGLGQTSTSPLFTEEGLPHPATYSNTASVGNNTLAGATGNIGLNVAAGDYNLQENAAVLSSAEGLIPARSITSSSSSAEASAFASAANSSSASSTSTVNVTTVATTTGTVVSSTSTTNSHVTTTTGSNVGTESGSAVSSASETRNNTNTAYLSGGAEASSYSLQNLYNTEFNSESYDVQNTVITNNASVGSGALNGASGNIGVNVAAGAFNIQKNALVIASVRGGNLAEAAAGTIQHSLNNETYNETVTNNATIGSALVGASGNIGVNIAAGVGNLQLNSLTIANALLPGAGPISTGTGPGGTTSTGPA